MEEIVPFGFNSLSDFLGYCDLRSRTPEALFTAGQADALYKMAGVEDRTYTLEDLANNTLFVEIRLEEMIELRRRINLNRNSNEVD